MEWMYKRPANGNAQVKYLKTVLEYVSSQITAHLDKQSQKSDFSDAKKNLKNRKSSKLKLRIFTC